MTHTFATLEVSAQTFAEIAGKLREAGYDHAFVDEAIAMHGIGLVQGDTPSEAAAAQQLIAVNAALEASVKLQSHYAELLNAHDGGTRLTFGSAPEWVQRLAVVATGEH